jgi:hypothetical protein
LRILGRRLAEDGALVAAVLAAAVALRLVPSWHGSMTEVCRIAGVAAVLTIGVLVVCRFVGPRARGVERTTSALFLAGMPLVYVGRWLEVDGASPAALGLEVVGLVVFGSLAAVGLRRVPWLVVAGIAAHGLGWDAGHWLFGPTFMFDWYAVACLLCDVGLSVYLAFRVPVWRAP